MGKAKSRRGGSAALAQEPSPPSRKRRRGKRARAAHAKPPRGERPSSQSVQAELPKNWSPAEPVPAQAGTGLSGEFVNFSGSSASPDVPPRAQAAASVAPWSAAPFFRQRAAARIPGPSLRQDIPRPPLRYLALRARRRGVLVWQRGRDRARAGAARTAAYVIAWLYAWVWQPVLWPFRPAQREMLARTLAVLSLAAVAAGWVAIYSALAPTDAARPAAPPPTAPKPFTARVVSHPLRPAALPPVDVSSLAIQKAEGPVAEVPLPIPAPNRRR